jgi:hypothetical protein
VTSNLRTRMGGGSAWFIATLLAPLVVLGCERPLPGPDKSPESGQGLDRSIPDSQDSHVFSLARVGSGVSGHRAVPNMTDLKTRSGPPLA